MKIDERVLRDITERLSGKEITAAKALAPAAKMRKLDATQGFSAKGIPGYFCGDRNAKTVVVNLNPGMDAALADCLWDIRKDNYNQTSPQAFINDLYEEYKNFGLRDAARYDEFDIKQAAFLIPWKDSGITLPQEIDNKDKCTCLLAKKNVLCQKLQLELVPYASSRFDIVKNDENRKLFVPYIDTLLDEIFAKERKYVIFNSAIFVDLFKYYNDAEKTEVFKLGEDCSEILQNRKGKCRVVYIHFNDRIQKALIAHTFPSQSLCRAFGLMRKYGEFCYKVWLNHP
jgi:hypothetical protein